MIDVEMSVEIDRPLEQVFEYVRDEKNLPAWDSDMREAKQVTDGPFGVGTRFHLDIKPFMGVTEGEGEVIGYEPGRTIELQFAMGKLNPHIWHRFEATGGGTRFTRHVQLTPGGFLKIMQPMMRGMIKKRNEKYLATLKDLLE